MRPRRSWKAMENCGIELVNLGYAFQTLAKDRMINQTYARLSGTPATMPDALAAYVRALEETLVRLRQATGVH